MIVRNPAAFLLPFAVATLTCCGSTNASTTTTTPTPTVVRTTDTFNGSVAVGASASHNFTVAQTGVVDITLTFATPPADVSLGIGVGTPGDAGCTPLAGASKNTQAGALPQLSGTITAGTLCVRVSDSGDQRSTVTYTVTVTHP